MSEAKFFKDLTFHKLVAKARDCPDDALPEIVLAGKSNVGKSSLINALAGRKNLAKVSASPGKTRHLIYYLKPGFAWFTDLPGYGYARSGKGEIERFSQLVESYFALERPFALVLLLLDIRHSAGAHDRQMIEFLKHSGLRHALVFTKCDKLSRQQARKRVDELLKELRPDEETACFSISSLKRLGVDELEDFLRDCVAHFNEEKLLFYKCSPIAAENVENRRLLTK